MTVPSLPACGLAFPFGLDVEQYAPSLYCILKAQLLCGILSSLLLSPPSFVDVVVALLFALLVFLRGLGLTRLVTATLATILALANASPRNPNVRIYLRSSTFTNLLVANLVQANGKSRG